VYPDGHIPGEKYAVESIIHPGGKQDASPETWPSMTIVPTFPIPVAYSDDKHGGDGVNTVVRAGGFDIDVGLRVLAAKTR
jgi:hypothetical protein